MTGRLTVVTTERPASLGKTYRLTAAGMKKKTAGQMVEGTFEVQEFSDVQSLAQVLASIGADQAIMASLPKDGSISGRLVTKAERVNHPGGTFKDERLLRVRG